MGIGAAEAKGAHPHHGGPIEGREGFQRGLNLEFEAGEINRRIGGLEVQAGGNLTVKDAERRFDQAGDAGGRFAMAQVGFHRAHPAGLTLGATFAQNRAQGPQFDRIPLAGASAVGFDVLGGGRIQAGAGKGLAHAGDLGLEVGGGHAIAAAVGIHGRAVDQGHDRITAAAGFREGLSNTTPAPSERT
jgi:hypothetical protein